VSQPPETGNPKHTTHNTKLETVKPKKQIQNQINPNSKPETEKNQEGGVACYLSRTIKISELSRQVKSASGAIKLGKVSLKPFLFFKHGSSATLYHSPPKRFSGDENYCTISRSQFH
jgi:hypothetical protein